MKNVTHSLDPSDSSEIIPMDSHFSSDDFTITIPQHYLNPWSKNRDEAARFMAVLEAMKKEAPKRGFDVITWTSTETLADYVRFRRIHRG